MSTPTAPGLLSRAEFRTLVDAIRAHGRAQAEAITAGHAALPAYPLPDQLRGTAKPDQLPDPVRDVLDNYGRRPTRDQLVADEADIAPAAEQCAIGQIGQAQFGDLIAQRIADDKTNLYETMDDLAQRLRDLGNEYPEDRVAIVDAMQSYADFAPDLWRQVYDYLTELTRDCRELWPGVPSYFDGFRNEVEEFFADLTG
ncbi:hypothetical protein ACRS6B_20950 [Nocardia asteroides]